MKIYVYFQHTSLVWYKPATWLSNVIQCVAKTRWNHAGVLYGIGDLYEAVWPEVAKTSVKDKVLGKNYEFDYVVYELNVTNDNMFQSINFACTVVGKPYDVFGMAFTQLVWHLLGVWIGSRTEKQAIKGFYCYELVWYYFKKIGLFWNDGKWWMNKPKTFFDKAEKYGFRKLSEYEFKQKFL